MSEKDEMVEVIDHAMAALFTKLHELDDADALEAYGDLESALTAAGVYKGIYTGPATIGEVFRGEHDGATALIIPNQDEEPTSGAQ